MEPITYISPESPRPSQPSFKDRLPHGKNLTYLIGGIILLVCVFYIGAFKRQLNIYNPFNPGSAHPLPVYTPDPDYKMPDNDPNRLNILVMGIRGLGDPDATSGGPLLTDSIQVFSYDKTVHKSSIVSIPRDLFITIHNQTKDKINSAYEYGFYHSGNSLQFIKDKISEITGVYIDEVVIFDFSSFKQIIDALGGIDITLATPFDESKEWGFKFHLPVGLNHMDGQTALYYARSRYSSSDFDRSRRQQQIIFAIKDKLLKLNFFGDPVKSFSILTLIRSDIKTDIGVWNISQLLDLANQVKFDQIKRLVISTDNLVTESTRDGVYILLPKTGNLREIKQFFQDSLD
jgi:LCP family protein required for cell wall assembly